MPKTIHSKVEEPTGNALQKEFTEADEAFFSEDNDEAPYYSLKDKRVRELKRIADLLHELEEFREDFRVDVKPKEVMDSVEGALQEWAQLEAKIREHASNPFLVDLVMMVLTGGCREFESTRKIVRGCTTGEI